MGCKADKWFLQGVTDSRITGEWPINRDILPQTSQNPGNLPIGDPVSVFVANDGQEDVLTASSHQIAISIPSYNNIASYTVKVGVQITCTGEVFDLRLDDFKLQPE